MPLSAPGRRRVSASSTSGPRTPRARRCRQWTLSRKRSARTGRELEAAAEAVEALERLATAIEALDDAPERKRYIGAYDAALSALEQRLFCDNYGDRHGPVTAAQTTADELIKPAREAVREEIARRRPEAAEREAARQAAAARREAEERKRKAIAEADAARAVLAASMPELDAATAPPTAVAE